MTLRAGASVSGSRITNSLKRLRERAGVTQRGLAERIGVSRQSVLAIEAGRTIPSTTLALELARVLECRVEDLFELEGSADLIEATLVCDRDQGQQLGPSQRVALGRVGRRWMAHPLRSHSCRAHGEIIGEILPTGRVKVRPLAPIEGLEARVLVGGCAPPLGLLAGEIERLSSQRRSRVTMTWLAMTSGRALELLAQGCIHIAGFHVPTLGGERPQTDLAGPLAKRSLELVNLLHWHQGLALAPNNPKALHSPEDLSRTDAQLALRPRGSGAQQLLERYVPRLCTQLQARAPAWVARDHHEVARWIELGLVDAGISIESAAIGHGLDFKALSYERFDLIAPRDDEDYGKVSRVLAAIREPGFLAQLTSIPGYHCESSGDRSLVEAP